MKSSREGVHSGQILFCLVGFFLFVCFYLISLTLINSQSTCLHARESEGREWRSLEKDTQITVITAF